MGQAVLPPNQGSAALLKGARAQAAGARRGSFPSPASTGGGVLPPPSAFKGIDARVEAALHGAPVQAPVASIPAPPSMPPMFAAYAAGTASGAPLPPGPGADATPLGAVDNSPELPSQSTPTNPPGFWSALGHEAASGFENIGRAFAGSMADAGDVVSHGGTLGMAPSQTPITVTPKGNKALSDAIKKSADAQAAQAAKSPGISGFAGRAIGGMLPFAASPEVYSGADIINHYQDARARGDGRAVSALDGVIQGAFDEFLARVPMGGKLTGKVAERLGSRTLARLAGQGWVARVVRTATAATGGQIGVSELQKAILAGAGDRKGAAQINPFDAQTLASFILTPFAVEGLHAVLGRAAGAAARRLSPDEPTEPPEDNGEEVGLETGPGGGAIPMDEWEPGEEEPGEEDLSNQIRDPATAESIPEKIALQNARARAASPVPDAPTPEPQADLLAQWDDMNDKATPRQGVLVPNGQGLPEKLLKRFQQARAQGRVVDLEQGQLVLKSAKLALKAKAGLNAGMDPQQIIGWATGAGDGKLPEHTAVVQGQTPEGAVARESGVTPAEIPAKVAEMAAEGKTPVVTTPQGAIERRAAGIEAEGAPVSLGQPPVTPEVLANEPQPSEGPGENGVPMDVGNSPQINEAAPPAPVEPPVEPPPPEVAESGESEAAPGAKPPETANPANPLTEQLKDATEQFQAEEAARPKRQPGGVRLRAERVAGFARAVHASAQALLDRGEVTPERAKFALDAAKRVERADLKSDEAYTKNRGVGHPMLNEHAANLVEAARGLLEPDHEPVVAEKAKSVRLRERATRVKDEPAAPKAPKVKKVRVMDDIPDEREPGAKLTSEDKRKLQAARDAYLEAARGDPAELARRETRLREIMDGLVTRGAMSEDDRDVMLAWVRGEARDRASPTSRDEEIEKEFSDQRYDHSADLDDDYSNREVSPGDRLIGEANQRVKPLMDFLFSHEGRAFSLHQLLDTVHDTLPETAGQLAPVRSLVRLIRQYAPDIPVMGRMQHVLDSRGNADPGTIGIYRGKFNDIQLRYAANTPHLQTLLHEAVHASAANFMKLHPDHPFTQEIERLRGIAERRARRMYGDDRVNSTIAYFQGHDADSARVLDHLYGLVNHHEFLSEAFSNGDFQKYLMNSEAYATPGERLKGTIRTQIGRAIKRLFGVHPDAPASLFDNVMQAGDDVMRTQHARQQELRSEYLRRIGVDNARAASPVEHALGDLAKLETDPRSLGREREVRRVAGNEAADVARDFSRSVGKKSVRALRVLSNANKTEDQLLRDNRVFFGKEDDANPVTRLRKVLDRRSEMRNKILAPAQSIVREAMRLPSDELTRIGHIAHDATSYGIDPALPDTAQSPKAKADPKFKERYAAFRTRYEKLSSAGQRVYRDARDFNKWAMRQNRVQAVEAALKSFSDTPITDAQRQALYNTKTAGDFDRLIGPGKTIDVGERNDALKKVLSHTAVLKEVSGPYFHLGRHGDFVVQAQPTGARKFGSKVLAENFADRVRDLSPNSEAAVTENSDGSWRVDFKAEYVSMHTNPHEAELERDRLQKAGLNPGAVTLKLLSHGAVPSTPGMEALIGDATRKLTKRGDGPETQALIQSMREAFTSILASRGSAMASRLARRAVGGVKPEEWLRNFSDHAQSTAYHTANLATMFDQGEILGNLRQMSKEALPAGQQRLAYKRGEFVSEIGKRMTQEAALMAQPHNLLNHVAARLGFLNYLASPSHAVLWTTQNFTTGIPVAAAKFGLSRAMGAFGRGMGTVFGKAFRETLLAHMKPGSMDTQSILDGVVKAVEGDKRMGKWSGHIRKMLDGGLVSSSFSNELENFARGESPGVHRVFDYARLMPQFADVFNRVSTGLAALELTNGDITKSLDFVRETHMDYSGQNKSRVFKTIGRVPGLNSVMMFRTYAQGMFHLLYSNIAQMRYGETKSRAEAAKTVAGLVLGTALFAGVTKAAVLEPVRFAVYAYHKLFGDDDKYYNLDNSIRQFVNEATGNGKISEAINGGLPRLLGFDLSSRMGLSDLLVHNPPDLISTNMDNWWKFGASLLGPMYEWVANDTTTAMRNFEAGHPAQALLSLVPIKAFQDGMKAYQLYTKGYRSSNGAQDTPPGMGDAVWRALGFKPSDVANAQDRLNPVYGYKAAMRDRKWALVQQYVTAPAAEQQSIYAKMQRFNELNPGQRITYSDLLREHRAGMYTQRVAQGKPVRDPGVNALE